MLKVRVIPTLLWKNHGLVKGIGFNSWRRVGTMLPAIKVYDLREVDEMIVVDITASLDGHEPDYESVEEFSQACFVPLTVGGGIRDIGHIRKLLRAGADKVSINSAAYDRRELVRAASDCFGSQCVVISVDARKNGDGQYECMSHAGTRSTGREPAAWAREMEAAGAGEILITSIEQDGAMKGYDLDLVRQVAEAVSIPVIASGGAGNYDHMFDAIAEGKASAVAAASIFHFTQQTPVEARRHLDARGIPVRHAL